MLFCVNFIGESQQIHCVTVLYHFFYERFVLTKTNVKIYKIAVNFYFLLVNKYFMATSAKLPAWTYCSCISIGIKPSHF